MDASELEEVLRVFEKSLSQIKWRLKPSSKSRLQTDILALSSRMRPCIMVDYGGKMPELGNHLCAFIKHCKQESSIFKLLHVLVVDDMVYLVQVRALADFVKSSLETALFFVDLEADPPKIMTQAEKSPTMMQLLSAQKLFASVFHVDKVSSDHLQSHETYNIGSSLDGDAASQSSELVDLSYCLQESDVTIPTLNGWLLGYPVIYLFGKDHIERAVYNLSSKSLHIYQIFVTRSNSSSKGHRREELMSFTVPRDLSSEGSNEPWAKSFLADMHERWEKCKHIWGSLHMEVSGCYPQAIAL
ncbi:hypothetical protein C2S53_011808 [Perilla frutescens var. hirtella]|uniref:Uncharacterized protein n=1 Tax=Perilla frutescens var. hirtella TaxID=608512 RepID=A0AAD4JHB2_PERFH|nr:hypothetical protein C2S51_020872 [Perilla frutescens var. frutescens]KAH6833406.1 hypothetical protein C2S53_011808 [Perilla frutescens var. hirtella]